MENRVHVVSEAVFVREREREKGFCTKKSMLCDGKYVQYVH